MADIRDLKNLQQLDLGGTQITGAGLVHIRELKGLQRLTQLAETQIDDAGMAQIQELNLQGVGLSGTQITDAGLFHIRELRRA